MPSRALSILAVVTVTAVIACGLIAGEGYSTAASHQRESEMVFPDFQHQLNEVTEIEVTRADGAFVLSHRKDVWVNMALGGFPVIPSRIEDALAAIAGMKYIAPKTKSGRWYDRLQVEDVSTTAKSTRLTFKNAADTILADIIIGKPKDELNNSGVYMRLPNDVQSWLATGAVDVGYDAADWSERTVVDYDARSLNALTIRKRDGEVVAIHRDQPLDRKMKLKNLPAGATVQHQYQIDYLSGLLNELNFADVKPVDTDATGDASFEIVVRRDSLVVTMYADEVMHDGTVWTRVNARVTDDSQASDFEKREASRIHSNFRGWNIKLPQKFSERLKIKLDDIITPRAESS